MKGEKKLKQIEAQTILDSIGVLPGIYCSTRPIDNSGTIRQILLRNKQTHASMGAFNWIAKLGWVFEVRMPTIHTELDLLLALQEFQNCRNKQESLEKAYSEYSSSRTGKNWETYVSLLATFYTK